MALALRPAEVSDYDGILACLTRNQMQVPPRERWLSIWGSYPFREEFAGIPRGYVLEADGAIVGSISSIWAKFAFGERELKAVFAASAAVDPAHRGGSIRLFGQQLMQPGVDLYINGSAAVATSKIMDGLKVPRVPQPDNDLILLWAVNGAPLVRAGLRRKNIPGAGALAWPVGLGLSVASRFALRRAGRAPRAVSRVESFSEEFDALWNALRKRATTLLQFRDRATLHWRYAHKIASGEATVLTVRRAGELAGYAILVRTVRPALGIVAHTIQDLQCVDDDSGLVLSLLSGAWTATRESKLDLLEWAGFTGNKRAIATRASLLRHRLDVWQAFYFTRVPSLKDELAKPESWDFGLYDSD